MEKKLICNKLIFEFKNVFINPCLPAIILMENLPKKNTSIYKVLDKL